MAKRTQAQLLAALKAATTPDEERSLALELLTLTNSRQMVDEALLVLEHLPLDESARPILRQKALHYFDHPEKDSGGLLRKSLIRLLSRIGHPDDADIYRAGLMVYELKPVTDVAQTCRAAALVGMATTNRSLACLHATRLLGEPYTSPLSGEPSLTALAVLARFDERLPIYAFLLRQGEDYARRGLGEVVGRAFELLGPDLPAPEFEALAAPLAVLDIPPASAGIITAVIERREPALYPFLNDLLDRTRHDDLVYFGLMALAAARDETLTALLYDRAARCSRSEVRHYLEAVELTAHPRREVVLAALEKRL